MVIYKPSPQAVRIHNPNSMLPELGDAQWVDNADTKWYPNIFAGNGEEVKPDECRNTAET
jgi:hypothetical protein